MNLKDTNGDEIQVKYGFGDDLVLLEGSYNVFNLFYMSHLFDFIGSFLGYDLESLESISDTKNDILMVKSKGFLDIFEQDNPCKVPLSSISRYSARKLFYHLGEKMNIEIEK